MLAQADSLSEKDKKYIVKISSELGIEFKQTNCPNCYHDQALVLWRELQSKDNANSKRLYVLRTGIDVIWKGRRVNELLQDDELAELLQAGFPKDYFTRINGEDGRWL